MSSTLCLCSLTRTKRHAPRHHYLHLPGPNLPGPFNKLGIALSAFHRIICLEWFFLIFYWLILLWGHLLTRLSDYNILSHVCTKQLKVLIQGTCNPLSLRRCEHLPCGCTLGRSHPSVVIWEIWRLLYCLRWWLLFPSCRGWKTSRWMKSPPPYTYKSRIKLKFKLNASLKGPVEEMMPTRGIKLPSLAS